MNTRRLQRRIGSQDRPDIFVGNAFVVSRGCLSGEVQFSQPAVSEYTANCPFGPSGASRLAGKKPGDFSRIGLRSKHEPDLVGTVDVRLQERDRRGPFRSPCLRRFRRAERQGGANPPFKRCGETRQTCSSRRRVRAVAGNRVPCSPAAAARRSASRKRCRLKSRSAPLVCREAHRFRSARDRRAWR